MHDQPYSKVKYSSAGNSSKYSSVYLDEFKLIFLIDSVSKSPLSRRVLLCPTIALVSMNFDAFKNSSFHIMESIQALKGTDATFISNSAIHYRQMPPQGDPEHRLYPEVVYHPVSLIIRT